MSRPDAPCLGNLRKTLSTHGVPHVFAGVGLPAPDDGVDIERIEFEAATASAGALRGYERGAAAKKRIEHKIAPASAVENRIGHERNGFDRWTQGKQIAFLALPPEAADARIGPTLVRLRPWRPSWTLLRCDALPFL